MHCDTRKDFYRLCLFMKHKHLSIREEIGMLLLLCNIIFIIFWSYVSLSGPQCTKAILKQYYKTEKLNQTEILPDKRDCKNCNLPISIRCQ